MYNVNAYSSNVEYYGDDPEYPRQFYLDTSAQFAILEAGPGGVASTHPIYRGIRCRDALDYIFSYVAAVGIAVPCDDYEEYMTHGYNCPREDLAYGANVRLTTDKGKSFLLFTFPDGLQARDRFELLFAEKAVPVFKETGIDVPKLHYSPRNSRAGSHYSYVVEFNSIYAKATFGLSFLTQLVRGCAEGDPFGSYTAYHYWGEEEECTLVKPPRGVSVVEYFATYLKKCLEIAEYCNVTELEYNEDSLDFGIRRLAWRTYTTEWESEMDSNYDTISYMEVVNFMRKVLSK